MKAIISPAKSLDLETPYPDLIMEKPIMEKHAEQLIAILKKLSPVQIQELMSVSPKLAELNYIRFNQWRRSGTKPENDLRPAIYMFQGDVYRGIDPHNLTSTQVKKMNKFTYILSGLYGILKPLTLICPYRLEMGTSLPNPLGNNLYRFWRNNIAEVLNKDLAKEKNPLLINLASEEYYKAIKFYLDPTIPIIHPIFLDRVKGTYKIVSFYAKKARGLMIRHMIKNPLSRGHLEKFDLESYSFSEKETRKWNQKKFSNSKKESTLVFLREHSSALS